MSSSTGADRATPTVPTIRARKVRDGAEPLVMVTAYDVPTARIADEGGVDLILVGDTLAMVVLGYEDTLHRRHRPSRGGRGPRPAVGPRDR